MADFNDKNEKSYDLHAEEWEATIPINLGHKYLEKPAMAELLPSSLEGRSVLCIGVGSGEELDLLLNRGAKVITAIDISNVLLKRAAVKFPTVKFMKMDMMDMSFTDSLFDLVYSSLAFHYSNDWDKLLNGVHRVMKKGGMLIFSTHRPEFWARKKKTGIDSINKRGVALIGHTDRLPGNVEILFFNHADTNAILESVTHAGFSIRNIVSPSMITPNPGESYDQEHYKALNQKNNDSPIFIVILATK